MIVEGVIFITSGLFYVLGRVLRVSIRPLGKIMTGLCGKVTLFSFWLVALLFSAIGSLWISLAKGVKTEFNSAQEGDPNYCAPEVWYLTQVTIYLFWMLSAVGLIFMMGKIYLFFLGPEILKQKLITIGN